jgi:NTE family protein
MAELGSDGTDRLTGETPRRMRTGLVLGGGGVLGVAYHAGVLAALQHDLGWDARATDVVVGTSAGSVVAALLRLGASPTDLAAVAVGADPWDTPEALFEPLRRDRPVTPPTRAIPFELPRPRMPDPGLVLRWMMQPWSFNPLDAIVTMLPDGRVDMIEELQLAGSVFDAGWPNEELAICAVRRRDCRQIVFDGSSGIPLYKALAASCAIPGHFAPVRVDGAAYVDGGVRSPTNADALSRRGVDLAIIVAPMAGGSGAATGPEGLLRRYARQKLDAERAALRRAGIRCVVIEPGVDVTQRMGLAFMDDDRSVDVARAAFFDAGDQLRSEPTAEILGPLRGRRPGQRSRTAA